MYGNGDQDVNDLIGVALTVGEDMTARIRPVWGVLAVALAIGQVVPIAQSPIDKDLVKRSNELLASYASYKGYASKDPAVVYKGLTTDRQAVFDAIVRALFVPIEDAKGKPGKRVIDFVEQVQGIWGVRQGQTQGRYMFRMTFRFAGGLVQALEASSNIPRGLRGHVLRSKTTGGDDEPAFKDFASLLQESGVRTFREANAEPKLQVSVIKGDFTKSTIGEVDIDFDQTGLFWCGCHCKPSNSDVGSRKAKPDQHVHLTSFNVDVPYFSTSLSSTWSKPAAHCKDSY
jgi:hypothetical protein